MGAEHYTTRLILADTYMRNQHKRQAQMELLGIVHSLVTMGFATLLVVFWTRITYRMAWLHYPPPDQKALLTKNQK